MFVCLQVLADICLTCEARFKHALVLPWKSKFDSVPLEKTLSRGGYGCVVQFRIRLACQVTLFNYQHYCWSTKHK